MFVLNVKLSKKNIVIAVLVLALIILFLLSMCGSKNSYRIPNGSDSEAQTAFLQELGWQVSAGLLETKEITIPTEFGGVYNNYNEIQKSAGYNLEFYKGKKVNRFTYVLSNYPDRNDVRVNLIIYQGTIIGGDISTTELNGFMKPLVSYNNIVNQ